MQINQPSTGDVNNVVNHGLTASETKVLEHLAAAWHIILTDEFQGMVHEDRQDFRRAINQAQLLIALRVAKRINPEVWA